MYTYKHIILYRLKWSLFTDKFVYEHIIIFESICLQVKPKFRLEHDSFDKDANKNLFFFSRTQSIPKYLYLFIALVVGDF